MGIILGKGAFGTVHRATLRPSYNHNRHQSDIVAIKILPKSTIRSRGLAARVRNEVTLHYQLRHRNILQLRHFFEDDENVYLVMEWASGGDLYRRQKMEGGAKIEEVRRWTRGIVDGLLYLHGHGIIHRDLKLSNILLSADSVPVQ